MIYHDYSHSELETMANKLNYRYDPERLTKPKRVDVYDIVDMLGARIAFEYLSPDSSYLGATLFKSGLIYVWPGNPYVEGMHPTKKYFCAGTIIIDRELSERKSENDEFTENFTVMHECFHYDKHQAYFKDAVHMSKSFTSYSQEKADKNSATYKIERQADYSAAAFLMPRYAVITAARYYLGYNGRKLCFCYDIKPKIKEAGRMFGVNYSPMCYRLQEIGILDRNFNSNV